jgi:hypothetical protein
MFGGAEGDRTPDLMTASHALSQLSYGPELFDKLEFVVTGYRNDKLKFIGRLQE